MTNTLRRLVGQRLTVAQVTALPEAVRAAVYLSWGVDNTALVTRKPARDVPNAVRCNMAAGCERRDYCLHAAPHTAGDNDGPSMCYDHLPYIVGGVRVWGEPCAANVPLTGGQPPQEGSPC